MNSKDIDWNAFQSKYLKMENGRQYDLVLSNWRFERKTFGAQEQNPKPTLVFDVLKVNDIEYTIAPLEWSTASPSLAWELKAIIERAENHGKIAISVRIKRTLEGKYFLIDMMTYGAPQSGGMML